ncbi:PAS domain-containing sensor histidine kinase [Chryseobacterium sp. KACC 21268]|nr:PAS domain-containing sensor histidine kinase [Chryseobacterium sp. KACC 21268]
MPNDLLPSSAEDFDDFFESSLCGFITTDSNGVIVRVNKKIGSWLNIDPEKLTGKRFSDILAVAGKIYFETHLFPLLRMQGYFDEVAAELTDTGKGKIPVFINGYEKRDENKKPLFIRFTLFRASDRRKYEDNLQESKQQAESSLLTEQQHAVIREQFIAVLGHDLRNPLAGVMSAAQMLARNNLNERDSKMVNIIQTGSKRMLEMINNIMDLARGRLGGGITIEPVQTDLKKLLQSIVDELSIAWPDRIIHSTYDIDQSVECDPARFSQLISNLLSNAITHGADDDPVFLKATVDSRSWEISVINSGKAIPQSILDHLFHPFHRDTDHSSSNGLGLGLFIASEIAKAHQGTLTVQSDEVRTCFTFQKKLFTEDQID